MPNTASKESIPFTGFSLGEYGSGGSWQVGFGLFRQRLLYKGAFTSLNVLRSIDSAIIPRSGLVEVTPTGLPTGVILGFCWVPVPSKTALVVIGANVWRFNVEAAGSAATNIGSFARTPTVPVAFVVDAGGTTYATVSGDQTYRIDVVAGTVTALRGSPSGTCICIFGESSVSRLVVGNTLGGRSDAGSGITNGSPTVTDAAIVALDLGKPVASATPGVPAGAYVGTVTAGVGFQLSSSATAQVNLNATATTALTLIVGYNGGANQLYASTGIDYTNWSIVGAVGADPNFPAQTINVGDLWPVNAVISQRTHLAVAKQNSWWVITGALNSPTLRPIIRNTQRWAQTPGAAAADGDDNIWFIPFFDTIPAVFDGAKMGETRTLNFNAGNYSQAALPPPVMVTRNMRHDEVFMAAVTSAGPMRCALRQEGLWTFHTIDVPGTNFAGAWVTAGSGGRIHLSDGGAIGVGARFYTWRTHLDSRPPISGNDMEANLDAGVAIATSFTLPEWWGRTGSNIQVRAVLVDVKRWNTGFAAHNHFDMAVTNLRQYVDVGGGASAPYQQPTVFTKTFDEATTAVPGGAGASELLRLQFNMPVEIGNGFQIAFTNLAGVAIQKLVVELEITGSEPRGV